MNKVPFFRSAVDESDIERVSSVLRTNFLTTGQVTAEFESKLADYTDTGFAVGTMSCTSAMHLCLIAMGVGPGDEVITTPMSFVATANVVSHVGARPVFADVDSETGNLIPELVEAVVTERTKAIIPVHLYGQMCDMEAICQIAGKYNLHVIEDAAHGLEARRNEYGLGSHSNAACLSFYATKNITSGEGGAVVTNDESLADRLRTLRLHGMSADAADRYTGLYRHYDVVNAGWKANMNNIQAALAIGQLERIAQLHRLRINAYNFYDEAFAKVKGIALMRRIDNVRHAAHLFTIRVDPDVRDAFLHGLQERGIGVAVNFRPIHLMSHYKSSYGCFEGQYPNAEAIGSSTISLPLFPGVTIDEQQQVIDAVADIAAELG